MAKSVPIKVENTSPSWSCVLPSIKKDDLSEELEYEEETDIEDFADDEAEEDCSCENNERSNNWTEISTPESLITEFPFMENGVGPKNIFSEVNTPEDLFNLFIDSELLVKLTKDTNSAYNTFTKLNPSIRQVTFSEISVSLKHWIPTNVSEMKVFLALILACALVHKPNVTDFWNDKNWLFVTPNFLKVMTKERFVLILKFLYYEENPSSPEAFNLEYSTPDTVRPIMDIFNEKFTRFYAPDREIYIDDIFLSVQERTQFIQHLSTNNCRDYGVRIWQLCDSITSYCCKMEFTVGLRNDVEHSNTNKIVFGLMEDYIGNGHHLFIQSFCTTIKLCHLLYERFTHVTGVTCLKNSELPSKICSNDSRNETPLYFRRSRILVSGYKYCSNDEVRLISTIARASDMFVLTRTGQEINIPEIVNDFHSGMGKDNSHNNLSWYLDNKMGLQTWKRIFFNILCRFLQNIYILYISISREKSRMHIPSYAFYMDIITNIINDYLLTNSVPIKNETTTSKPFIVKSANSSTFEEKNYKFKDVKSENLDQQKKKVKKLK